MASTVTLSLISHTNAGKTTLARTLLRSDVGEVRDAAHVTLFNTPYSLIEDGDAELILWDTPGFGDSGRLLSRLKRLDSSFGRFFSQVWDRFTDKALWCSQQALKNVRDDADVVLYLVNASETIEGSAFVLHEIEILEWLNKPVLVLLNQVGQPRPAEEEKAEEEGWREHLKKFNIVKGVLSLDAFTRCWVQERVLMEKIEEIVPDEKRPVMTKLRKAWQRRNEDVFHESMKVLSHQLTANALDGVTVKPETLLQRIGFKRAELQEEWSEARKKLSESLANRAEQAMNSLIRLHGLDGSDEKGEMLREARETFVEPKQVEVALWGALGSIASGALAGLVVDLKAGGLTFGGGALLGGILGGAGTYALIKSYQLVKGEDNRLHWSREHFREQVKLALLSYLAVAHFGRGRGAWRQDSIPQHWHKEVEALAESYRETVDYMWKNASNSKIGVPAVQEEMELMMRELGKEILLRLYPMTERE